MLNSQQQALPTADTTAADGFAIDTSDSGAAADALVMPNVATGGQSSVPTEPKTAAPQDRHDISPARHQVDRGLTTRVAPLLLKDAIRQKALSAANRFRVIRTFDLAAICFPERPYKAALTAAQRAMRGLVKDGFLLRYRTDRQQHVYGLTQRGARWLVDQGVEAGSSVRRVNDMTNPEHLLWSSFIVVCCEARGLVARTESELLRDLKPAGKGGKAPQGLMSVEPTFGKRAGPRLLRPDAIAYEGDGATWFEIDRSKRGHDREASLAALLAKVGTTMLNQRALRRVVVFAKTERIFQRALAIARLSVRPVKELRMLAPNERALQEVSDGLFEVWANVPVSYGGNVSSREPARVGHVVVQMLPLWLPKVRIDARKAYSVDGWFSENYLPYRRAPASPPWPAPTSPFLPSMTKAV